MTVQQGFQQITQQVTQHHTSGYDRAAFLLGIMRKAASNGAACILVVLVFPC
jgi:hypothetical protein